MFFLHKSIIKLKTLGLGLTIIAMYNFFLLVGAIIIVIGLMFLRIRCSPVLHYDAKLFINLLSKV